MNRYKPPCPCDGMLNRIERYNHGWNVTYRCLSCSREWTPDELMARDGTPPVLLTGPFYHPGLLVPEWSKS